VSNNSDSHKLLSVVTTVHHEGVGETLDDWALCLSKSLLCVSTGRVGDVDWGSDLDIITAIVRPSFLSHSIDPYVKEISRISTSS
jgi:hypothetical protein